MMASLYQASQEQTILKQVMMASLHQASQEQTILAAGGDGLSIPCTGEHDFTERQDLQNGPVNGEIT